MKKNNSANKKIPKTSALNSNLEIINNLTILIKHMINVNYGYDTFTIK